MKQTDNLQKQMTPVQDRRYKGPLADQSVLHGLPLRPVCESRNETAGSDWLASFMWLRVPLLLLGVVGALGLLAHYKPRFAEVSAIIHWPGWWVSVIFLGIAGCVFFLLLIDWLYVLSLKCVRSVQRKNHPEQRTWRCR